MYAYVLVRMEKNMFGKERSQTFRPFPFPNITVHTYMRMHLRVYKASKYNSGHGGHGGNEGDSGNGDDDGDDANAVSTTMPVDITHEKSYFVGVLICKYKD